MKDFVAISKYSGMREDLVQAGGGNSSVKIDEKRMLIKASGVQLADVTENYGYSIVDYPMTVQYMKDLVSGVPKSSESAILREVLLEGTRSSIETFLHAITGKVTLHTHSVAVNILAAREGGMETLKTMFPEALIVGYATPGVKLAELYYETYLKAAEKEQNEFQIIFLKNHGVIISADTADEVIQLTEMVNRRIEENVGLDNSGYHYGYELYQKLTAFGIDNNKIIVKAENKKVLDTYKAFSHSMWDYQICPDCLVFCGKRAYTFDETSEREEYISFINEFGNPVLVEYKNNLFIIAESVKKAREIESVLAFSAQIALFNKDIPMDILSEDEQDFLLNWESEKYRQKIK